MKTERAPRTPVWGGHARSYTSAAILLALLLFTIGFFGFGQKLTSFSKADDIQCTPDAGISVTGDPNALTNVWDGETALWITLAFGRFSFAGAKAVDLAWDLIIGRGGQLLLVYLTYPTIRQSVQAVSGRVPVYTPLYTSFAFDGVSLITLWQLFRGAPPTNAEQALKLRRRVWMLSILWRYLAILPIFVYILLFPTLLSVMTGYQADLVPFVLLPDGNYMNASSLHVPSMVVIDGSRIGLSDMHPWELDDPVHETLLNYRETWRLQKRNLTTVSNTGAFVNGVATKSVEYGCYTPSDGSYNGTECHFKSYMVGRPYNSDISSSSSSYDSIAVIPFVNSTITLNNKTWSLADPPLSIAINGTLQTEKYFATGDIALNTTYLATTSQCQPMQTYVWGFSFLMLFLFCILSMVFVFVLACVRYDIDRNKDGNSTQPHSVYRDVLNIATEIRRITSHDTDALTNEALAKMIREDKTPMNQRRDLLLTSGKGPSVLEHEDIS